MNSGNSGHQYTINISKTKTTTIDISYKPEKEEKPKEIQNSKPLDKLQAQKLLSIQSPDDYTDKDYNPELDLNTVIIFDDELTYIRELKAVDMMFVIDTTEPMKYIMKGVKRYIRKIVWDVQKCLTQYLLDEVDVLKVGIIGYKSHKNVSNKDSKICEIICDLTADLIDFKDKLLNIKSEGDNDSSGIIDAIHCCNEKIKWREKSYKFIYNFMNAVKYENNDECECGIQTEEVFTNIRTKDIKYTIIKLDDDNRSFIERVCEYCKIEIMDPEMKWKNSRSMLNNIMNKE